MQFHNDYYISQPSEQLKAQQLSRNVFFGPLNVLSRHSFLKENNIRFFICIGIPTQRLVNLTSTDDETLMINFDLERDSSQSDSVTVYQEHNTRLLRQIIDIVLAESFQPEASESKCLTPQPEQLNRSLFGNLEYIYQNGNIFVGATGLKLFEIFNDLLAIFNAFNPNASTFIFSQNGNGEDLTTLLMSQILLKNPYIKISESFQFIKSLRPTISDIKDEQLFWFNGLVGFYEAIKRDERCQDESPSTQKFRKRIDSMEEANFVGNSMGKVRSFAKCKRTRLDL